MSEATAKVISEDAEKSDQEAEAKLALLQSRLSKMHTEASMKYGLSFKPRATDIFVVSYPKTGTTRAMCIAHALRSRGDLNFRALAEECPWDICALDCKQDLDADHKYSPRVFKSHERYSTIAKGGKYIYMMRNPEHVLESFFHFLPDYVGMKGQIPLELFASEIFLRRGTNSGTIFDHYADWIPHFQDSEHVLPVFFEDMAEDAPAVVTRIAAFMGIPCDAKLLAVVEQRASFQAMVSGGSRYDGSFVWSRVKDQMGIPSQGLTVGKVRKSGGPKAKRSLPDHLKQALQARWTETLTQRFGFANFAAFRSAWSCLRNRSTTAAKSLED